MISKPIMKNLFVSNKVIITIFVSILMMYQTILIFMYSPSMIDKMSEMAKSMGTVGNIYGMDNMAGGFTGYLAQMYFGMIIPMFMLIYNIIIGNKVVAGMVDKGSMACLLASPNTRNKVSLTNGLFIILSNIFIIAINAVVGVICCMAHKGADISIKHFIEMNLGAVIMLIAVSSICFMFSCIFNESKSSLALGGGIPILFLLFYLLSDMGEKLKVFKKMTIFSLFKPVKIASNDYTPMVIGLCVLAIMSIILYTVGIKVFNKKDLPI